MKIIRNNIIPFPGFKAINLFGVLFVKNNAKIDDVTINHEGYTLETIHRVDDPVRSSNGVHQVVATTVRATLFLRVVCR